MSYAELIARLEAATEPDAGCDMALWWLSLHEDTRASFGRYVNETVAKQGTDILAQFYDSSKPHCIANLSQRQKFTASTDEAIAFADRMLRGVVLDLKMSWDNLEPTTRPAVSLRWYPPGTSGTGWHATVESAPNIAISVCLATVRALERMRLQNDKG